MVPGTIFKEGTHPRRAARIRRHLRIRRRLMGTPQRPRLSVFRSHQHFYVQLIDDLTGHTLVGCSTLQAKSLNQRGGDVEAARWLGRLVAEEAKKRGITQVVFDRGGYLYHGRVQALAEACREGGLQF